MRRTMMIIGLAGALALAGCGSDDNDGPNSESGGAATVIAGGGDGGEVADLTLIGEDNVFDQETITVSAGDEVTIEFENAGAAAHNASFYEGDSAGETIFEGDIVEGGDSTTYTFDAPDEAGTYYFRCDLHPAEMEGDFIVE